MYSLSLKNIFQSRVIIEITIIDSGLGGIEFSKRINELKVFPLIDYEAFPYGNKELDWLRDRLIYLVEQATTKTVVVACNTLSSIIYKYDLKFKKRVVDVVTPTIYFFRNQNYKNICILATKNTIKMDVYSKLLGVKINYIDATKLIDCLQYNKEYKVEVQNILSQIPKETDAILLGCTHLIAVKDYFRKKMETTVISQDEIFNEILEKNRFQIKNILKK